jgi:hypothetical protein
MNFLNAQPGLMNLGNVQQPNANGGSIAPAGNTTNPVRGLMNMGAMQADGADAKVPNVDMSNVMQGLMNLRNAQGASINPALSPEMLKVMRGLTNSQQAGATNGAGTQPASGDLQDVMRNLIKLRDAQHPRPNPGGASVPNIDTQNMMPTQPAAITPNHI